MSRGRLAVRTTGEKVTSLHTKGRVQNNLWAERLSRTSIMVPMKMHYGNPLYWLTVIVLPMSFLAHSPTPLMAKVHLSWLPHGYKKHYKSLLPSKIKHKQRQVILKCVYFFLLPYFHGINSWRAKLALLPVTTGSHSSCTVAVYNVWPTLYRWNGVYVYFPDYCTCIW